MLWYNRIDLILVTFKLTSLYVNTSDFKDPSSKLHATASFLYIALKTWKTDKDSFHKLIYNVYRDLY